MEIEKCPPKSLPRLLLHGFSKTGILYFKDNIAVPAKRNISQIAADRKFPWRLFIMNMFAVAIMTIGVLSAVYAAYINPEFRTTASSMSSFINGFATIIMFAFIDPQLSAMTDDVMLGKCPESVFRKYIVYVTVARLIGTFIAQLLFLPGAHLIAVLATKI